MRNRVANCGWTQPPRMLTADGCKTFVARVAILQNTEFTNRRSLSGLNLISQYKESHLQSQKIFGAVR